MRVTFLTWPPQTRPDGLVYRNYGSPREVECTIAVSILGSLSLMAEEELQQFGIVTKMEDAAGQPFMDNQWYQINRIVPMLDTQGYLYGYRHQLAVLAPEVMALPITPPGNYPDFDQV